MERRVQPLTLSVLESNMEDDLSDITPGELPLLNPNEVENILAVESSIWDNNVKIYEEPFPCSSQIGTNTSGVTSTEEVPGASGYTERSKVTQLDIEQQACKKKPTEAKKEKIMLDDFLWILLQDPQYNSYIQWAIKDRLEFKLVRPEMVAQLWGEFRKKKLMNYEKLSRGLRYYFESNKIERVPFKQHHFRFLNKERYEHRKSGKLWTISSSNSSSC